VEVKIGVQHAPRELVVETNASPEEIEAQLAEAVSSSSLFVFTDSRGRRIAVPGDKVAYVEIGGGVAGAVGFR
jgi:hypothetical protein